MSHKLRPYQESMIADLKRIQSEHGFPIVVPGYLDTIDLNSFAPITQVETGPITDKRTPLMKHLDECVKTVTTWPEWKVEACHNAMMTGYKSTCDGVSETLEPKQVKKAIEDAVRHVDALEKLRDAEFRMNKFHQALLQIRRENNRNKQLAIIDAALVWSV